MRISWFVAVLLLWIGGSIISQTLEYLQPMSTATTANFWSMIQAPLGGSLNPLTIMKAIWDWVQVFWVAFSWNYSFFVGVWELFRYLGWCLSAATVVCLVLAVRGTGSA